MKIAMIGQKGIPTLYGGIERHVEELSIRLVKNSQEVFVYTRPYYTPKDMKTYKGVNLVSVKSIKSKHLDAITHTLLSTLHAIRQGYDVIHYQGVGPSLLSFIPRIFKPSVKVVTTFHCRDSVLSKWGWFASLSLNLGEWTSTRFAHETITVSKSLQAYIKENYKKQVNYIPTGVQLPQNKEANLITSQFGLTKNSYIVAVARLIEDKGLHYLVEAYKNLKTDKKLVIVGDASFTDEYVVGLKEMANDNSNIIFTGWQSGTMLDELFSNAYMFAHPSVSEGLPVAVLEAASYGLPIVASNIPANKEVIEQNGLLFENRNIEDLQTKLKIALDSPEYVKSLGVKARAYVQETYDWNKVAISTIDLYKQVKQIALEAKKSQV